MKRELAAPCYKVLCLARTFLSSMLSRVDAIKCHSVYPDGQVPAVPPGMKDLQKSHF